MTFDIQVIIHDGDVQADLVHILWRDVENDGFIVGRVECILFDGGLLLFQALPVTNEGHFDVGICAKAGICYSALNIAKQLAIHLPRSPLYQMPDINFLNLKINRKLKTLLIAHVKNLHLN